MLIKASAEIIIDDFKQPAFADCEIILTPTDGLGKEVLPYLFSPKSYRKLVVTDSYLLIPEKEGKIRITMRRRGQAEKVF